VILLALIHGLSQRYYGAEKIESNAMGPKHVKSALTDRNARGRAELIVNQEEVLQSLGQNAAVCTAHCQFI